MSDFFNHYLNLSHMMREKREYKRQMARLKALPADYRFVFEKIQTHMWKFTAGAGYDMLPIQYDLIDLFETGAAEGKEVLEVTGEDVAGFCEELLKNARTTTEDWRKKLNREVAEKLKKERDA